MHHAKKLIFWLLLIASPAMASKEPILAKPAQWVEKIPIPAIDPARKEVPVLPLLINNQTKYEPDSASYYFESAIAIQQPEVLALLGNISVPWQADVSDLLIHKVQIIRDGKVIDLLANGQKFTVLRRENNLELAMLDGVLTATLQPEGLAVGDIINLAYTIRTKSYAIPLRGEHLAFLPPGIRIQHAIFREIWPASTKTRWNTNKLPGKPQLKKTDLGAELILDLTDVESPLPLKSAPARYNIPASLEVSQYDSWNEISRIFAPVYAKAGQLDAASPLKTEIERIAASSPDPLMRAMSALRLVQDNIRYLALNMGDSGYMPATAEQSWARKFGDCKGKAVVLIALLKNLGIEAEPVFVSTEIGDSLGERLPLLNLFNHVIVKAKIGENIYWLDGTRTGDRDINNLKSSPFRWGLPVNNQGSDLEKLLLLPPSLPLRETNITYDASKGIFAKVPINGEVIFRGDFANVLRLGIAQLGEDEFKKRMKDFISDLPKEADVVFSIKVNEDTGAVSVIFQGADQMEWSGAKGGAVSFQFDNDTIEWAPEFKHDVNSSAEIPFVVDFPVYVTDTKTIILPDGGKNFTLEGKSLDQTVAGAHISRALSLGNGRAIARSTFQTITTEISSKEAQSSKGILETISANEARIRAPANVQISGTEKTNIYRRSPSKAEAYNQEGYQLLQKEKYEEAIVAFDKATAIAPNWSSPITNRAIALINQNKLTEAEAALKRAASINTEDFALHQGYGLLYLARDKPVQAISSLTRSLELSPDNVFDLIKRFEAYAMLGDYDEALANLEQTLAIDPKNWVALVKSSELYEKNGDIDKAIAIRNKIVSLYSEIPDAYALLGEMLERSGHLEEAAKAYKKANELEDNKLASDPGNVSLLSLKMILLSLGRQHQEAINLATLALENHNDPNDKISLLNGRSFARVIANIELHENLKDCDVVLQIDPKNLRAWQLRGLTNLRLAQWQDAIADYTRALALNPMDPESLYGRGIARIRMNDSVLAKEDFTLAHRYAFDVYVNFDSLGIKP
jgi:tetratricopeptide (TPR) repeat protein